jgi:hypothetical protein
MTPAIASGSAAAPLLVSSPRQPPTRVYGVARRTRHLRQQVATKRHAETVDILTTTCASKTDEE